MSTFWKSLILTLALSELLVSAYPRPVVSSPLSLFSSCRAQHSAVLAVFLRSLFAPDPFFMLKHLEWCGEDSLAFKYLIMADLGLSFLMNFFETEVIHHMWNECESLVSWVILRLSKMHNSRGELSYLKF